MKLPILFAFAVLVLSKRIIDPKAVLAEIDDTHAGKTFLDAI